MSIREAERGHAKKVVIVGGGAAGTLAAVHLLRAPQRLKPLAIELIDREGSFGPGVAYGTADPLHLLNVPVVRMGGISGQPEHFLAWLREREPATAEEAFVPRGAFGEYLRELLAGATAAAGKVSVERRVGEVVSATQPAAGGLRLTLADGSTTTADQMILALGPLDSRDPIPVPAELRENGVYVGGAWRPGALDRARGGRRVLIVGTGLTMVDVALSLGADPQGPRIRATSRHGLLPRRHRRDLTRIRSFPIPIEQGRLEPVLAAIFGQIASVAKQGDDWRDVIDSIRPATPAIWKALRPEEKRRFMAELQRLWDVHRFRMAPDVADRLEDLRRTGRISVSASAVASVEPQGDRARVALRTPGSNELETLEVDSVVNCAGAGCDLRREAPPLLRSLLDAGAARPDGLGLGLDVSDEGALLDADGLPSRRIHVVGALRKGVEWEAIGITEIRDQAAAVAAQIGVGANPTIAKTSLEAAA